MLRKLRQRFGWADRPISSHTIPSPPIPDAILADEEPNPEDITRCIGQIRARRSAPPRDSNRTQMLLALGAAEQFAADCLEYGPDYKATTAHIAKAVDTWAQARGRTLSDTGAFVTALQTLLEFRGGAAIPRPHGTSGTLLLGVRLSESAVDMLNGRIPKQRILVDPRLQQALVELLG